MNNTTDDYQYLQLVRALGLVISEQNLIYRQALSAVPGQKSADLFNVCSLIAPAINWYALAKNKLNKYKNHLAQAVSIFEQEYPLQLRQIADPPWVLFYAGHQAERLVNRTCVSIVGSRRADYFGLELAERFGYELASRNVVVVSGLALGIDASAHIGALQSHSEISTVAVLGSGLNVMYPAANKQIYQQIVDRRGIIFSQFEPDIPPYPANFLNRNRVVSGLSSATIVIQATLKSGSLVTAKHSIEQGKDVYVIPGDIDNKRYEGSNRLIQQGAQLITGLDNLMQHLGLSFEKHQNTDSNSLKKSALSQQILKIIEDSGSVKVDEIVRQLGNISFEKDLLELEMSGKIQRLPGNVLKLSK